jgi:hypothetical protein
VTSRADCVCVCDAEFDKQTSLGAATSFSEAMPADSFLASDATKKICAQVSDELVTIVPRVDDHTCPICLSIAWLPVRLACEHVFCIRCVVKMQNSKKRQCPLCRKEVVMAANLGESGACITHTALYVYGLGWADCQIPCWAHR